MSLTKWVSPPEKYFRHAQKHVEFINSKHEYVYEILEVLSEHFDVFYVQSVKVEGPCYKVTILTNVIERVQNRITAQWALRTFFINSKTLSEMKKETILQLPTDIIGTEPTVDVKEISVEPSTVVADETGTTRIVRGEEKVQEKQEPAIVAIFFDNTSKQPVVIIDDEIRVATKKTFNASKADLVPYDHKEHNIVKKPTAFELKFAYANTPLHVLKKLLQKNPLVRNANINTKNNKLFFSVAGLSVTFNAFMNEDGLATIITTVDPRLASNILRLTPSVKVITKAFKKKNATQQIDLSAIDLTKLKVK